ncbi:MAG: UDP-N-acetylglucosamine pyrophosphorylase [Candidatus Sericytochromatia bacterium]
MSNNFTPSNLLDLEKFSFSDIFSRVTHAWEVLPLIKEFLLETAKKLPNDFEQIEEFVWVAKNAKVEKNVTFKGPAIIGYETEVRHCAYIRENVLVGNNVTIGNSTEIKNSILFDGVQVPHFNYVGDSVMGYKAHLGAGVILSNVKSTKDKVKVLDINSNYIDTGLKKFGAIIGDFVEVGCNSVLNPGTVVGKNSIIYPLTSARGFIPENHILKNNGSLVKRVIR